VAVFGLNPPTTSFWCCDNRTLTPCVATAPRRVGRTPPLGHDAFEAQRAHGIGGLPQCSRQGSDDSTPDPSITVRSGAARRSSNLVRPFGAVRQPAGGHRHHRGESFGWEWQDGTAEW